MAPTTGARALPRWKRDAGYRYEADKFRLAGWHASPSLQVRAPRIAECPLQLEARLTHQLFRPLDAWRDGAQGYAIMELEVLHVHAHADIVVPGTQHIDPLHYSPLFYLFRHYVGRGESLGRTFKAQV
jgi:flavin reductase (DIM6/NTAB) family NADH-FMN oxidoreductase RutF